MNGIASYAARHVAEKIRQSIKAGGVTMISVFGQKRITVVLDLEMARAFAEESEATVASGEKSGPKST